MSAPFHTDLAEAPDGGEVVWETAEDGVRLRIGMWRAENARGTILLFPGRTEFIEKYGRIISVLVDEGYCVSVIDWRGQGYSDRLCDDPAMGHVGAFSDYQLDVQALVGASEKAALPKPWHLLSHSMGGNIGLRSLLSGLEVERAVFSAPMWGIMIPASKRATAALLPTWARLAGKELEYLPGSNETSYLVENGFEDNLLTTDRSHFEYLARFGQVAPELALGGPSIQWFTQAQAECSALLREPRPDLPTSTFLGTLEGIVDPVAVHKILEDWPRAQFCEIDGARHELMMEADSARREFLQKALSFLGES